MAAKIQEVRQQLEHVLRDENKPWASIFGQLEAKTGVDRMIIFISSITFVGIYLVFGFGAQLICNVIGFLYPAYRSIKAIESPQKDDDTKWLTYWVVFAMFSIVEYFADIVASWFPLYWLSKCFFMIWLMMPTEFNGSVILYKRIIRPYFLKYQGPIDSTLSSIRESAAKAAASATLKSD